MKSKITWTDKRREIAELAGQGKEFTEITALGYSKNTTSIVLNALKGGQKPELKPEPGDGGTEGDGDGGTKPLIAVTGPKAAPIMYRIDQKQIVLDPLELNKQYGYYADMAKGDNLGYSFSEVLTMGIQLVWFMRQNIPFTENMLRAVLYSYK